MEYWSDSEFSSPSCIVVYLTNLFVADDSLIAGIGTSLHSNRRFTARDGDGDLYDAANLAQRIASPGLPPLEFLNNNLEKKADFWD